MVVQVVIGPTAIRDLILLGWLRDGERTDRQAVRDAFVRFANRRWVTRDILKRLETGGRSSPTRERPFAPPVGTSL